MLSRFTRKAIRNTVEIAERCHADHHFGHVLIPSFSAPDGSPPEAFLAAAGINQREAAEVLGHSDMRTTAKFYQSVDR